MTKTLEGRENAQANASEFDPLFADARPEDLELVSAIKVMEEKAAELKLMEMLSLSEDFRKKAAKERNILEARIVQRKIKTLLLDRNVISEKTSLGEAILLSEKMAVKLKQNDQAGEAKVFEYQTEQLRKREKLENPEEIEVI